MATLQQQTAEKFLTKLAVDGPACPLCDTPWEDEQHLLDHLKAKLAKSAEAQRIQEALLQKGTAVAQAAIRVAGLLGAAQKSRRGRGMGLSRRC